MTSADTERAQMDAFRLVGFTLAHAAWSIEEGGDLVPMGFAERDGEREAMRFATEITAERLPELHAIVAGKLRPATNGTLAFAFVGHQQDGTPLAVIEVQIVDEAAELVGTVRQAYQPAQKSRFPGRSSSLRVIGTPSPSDEVDVPGCRENVLYGVMSHPEGERLFPQLAEFAREMIAQSQAGGPG